MPKRRYQEGRFSIENGHYYSFFNRDRKDPDGTVRTVKHRIRIGEVGKMSRLQARREHDRLRDQINRERGSVPVAPKGETFGDAAKTYMSSVAPHLASSTVRQRQCHLRKHLLPRFGTSSLMSLDVPSLQGFATDMLRTTRRKTIINVLGTLFAVMEYAGKCGIRVPGTKMSSLMIRAERGKPETPFFTPDQAKAVINESRDPYKTIFALAWATGMRAGELLGLTVRDIDFQRGLITPRKQADERTRVLRELKTNSSLAAIPMTEETATMLKSYIQNQWRSNPLDLLFPNCNSRPRRRESVVEWGLKPVLRKIGLPTKEVGLHAFRHGLGTALSNAKVSPKVVQQIMRHADIKTTFRYYVHSDVEVQRSALEAIELEQSAG
ncbi:MAG: tyrosine-type recombinase/integrase [Candidatus Acidiferrales bacterium]